MARNELPSVTEGSEVAPEGSERRTAAADMEPASWRLREAAGKEQEGQGLARDEEEEEVRKEVSFID